MYGYGYLYPNSHQVALGSAMSQYALFRDAVWADGGTIYDEVYSFGLFFEFFDRQRISQNGATLITGMPASKVSVLYGWDVQNQTLVSFAVSRAGTKWTLRKNGNLEEWPANLPAFEWNAGGTYRGVSVEPGATNICLQSQTFSSGTWAKNATGVNTAVGTSGIEANVATAPDGTLTADRVNFLNQSDADAGLHQSFATSVSTAYTNSIYVKGEGSDIGKQIRARIRRNTGTANTVTTTITLTGEWQRVSTNYTTLADNTNVQLVFSSAVGGAVTALIWQNQFELGSVATSIIPTVASTANRVADSVTLTGASALIGQTQGWVFAQVNLRAYASVLSRRIIDLYTDGNNRISLTYESGGALAAIIVLGVVVQAGISTSVITAGTYKIAMAYANNDVVFYVNGVQIGTDVSATIPATSIIGIGSGSGGVQLGDNVLAVANGMTRIPNAQLQALTTP